MNDSAVTQPPSASVEDYVKAIWGIAGSGTASTKDVAERLSIAPPSVTNMFVRLREMGLVEYERYRGFRSLVVGERRPCGWYGGTV